MRKCNWCGLEYPLPYDAELCPHCTNDLNGTLNETMKMALWHYHNGVKSTMIKTLKMQELNYSSFLQLKKILKRAESIQH